MPDMATADHAVAFFNVRDAATVDAIAAHFAGNRG
jgi:hypothetical protein